ncbi:kyphoscoliosis peptidase-like [Mizuhopecten yessoensis]|uniref:Kyphoscoliosis peptidase n=1 Tax=Mizuhopecten yessoensis TaxID=6573 RepID=A0A210PZF8_MIZYE|nr:kyphoscoliosis peptidase-like [Mizuhopecten yessoensis]OWF41862.1 Kyphoscoliosis peptidase [Mizuhopecten yessoensis]
MGCGTSTQTKPTKSRETHDTVISDVDLDDNYNESSTNKRLGNSSKNSSSTPAITVTQTSATKRHAPTQPQTAKQSKSSTKSHIDESLELEALDGEDYPPKPCKLKKIDIVPDVSMFKNIDEHVAKTPKSATASIPELAKYLCQPAKNHLEKIRAIYQWVSRNIEYDVAGFLNLDGAQKKSNDPDSVLRNRCSVCQGYADLFLSLCREVNVPAKTISGYAKGYGHKAGVAITTKTDTNHAWNVVFVNNEWRLVDCTWDAGHVGDNKFHRHEGEFYFLTDPDIFINDHFPYTKKDMTLSQQWQLLNQPRDLENFSKLVKMPKQAVLYDVDLVSHKESIIPVTKEVVVKLVARGKLLNNVGARLSDVNGTLHDQCVFVEKERETTYSVTVRPQKLGKYTLSLYGNQGEQNSLNSLVSYVIDCKIVDKTAKPFPVHFGLWGAEPNYAEYGFDKRVAQRASFESDTGELEMRLPVIEPVKALGKLAFSEDDEGDDEYIMLEQGQSELVVQIRMNRAGFYKFLMFAKKENGSSYEKVLQYLIYCKNPVKQYQPFPKVFPEAMVGRMTLIEPKTKSIPAETDVHFRLTSSVIDIVRIGTNNFERGDNNTWNIDVMTPSSGEKLNIFGRISDSSDSSYKGLYAFDIA